MPDTYGGPTDPGTLLARRRGGTVGALDATLVREGAGGEPELPVRHDLDGHPRVWHIQRSGATSWCAATSVAW